MNTHIIGEYNTEKISTLRMTLVETEEGLVVEGLIVEEIDNAFCT